MKKVTRFIIFKLRLLSVLLALLFVAGNVLTAAECTETNSATGNDSDPVTVTINSFPCVGGGTITAMTMDASIGTFCPSWYSYDILVNGSTIATDQCDQTDFDLTAYLPITEVSIVSNDMDVWPDFITLELTLNITYEQAAGLGDDCVTPIVIEEFPYSDMGQTTCGRGNNYSNTCLGSYDGGEDIFYEFTITEESILDLSMEPSVGWTGVALFDACPPGANCVAQNTGASGTRYLEGIVLDPGTYYIMIDTWPSPDCIPAFDLLVDVYAVPPIGANCDFPIVIEEFPYSDIGQTTCGMIDDYSSTCLESYDGGEDIIYEFILDETAVVNISMDPLDTGWTGLGLFDDCPPGNPCIASVTGASGIRTIEGIELEPGTYYIMVDTWPSPDCIPEFNLDIELAPPLPAFDVVDLLESQDMIDWTPVIGDIENGFSMLLVPSVEYYYLDLGDGTMTNMPLDPGYFPFYLNQDNLTTEFFDYWAAKGVVEGASGWQAVMWDIINGESPMFYIKVNEAKEQNFMLVDGLQYILEQGDQYLRVNGDYPTGTYVFDGEIASGEMDAIGPVSVTLTFANPMSLPFMEPWDEGTFAHQQWSAEGNWRMTGSRGNPAPSAEFYWSPGTTDYSHMLNSNFIDGSSASKVIAQFDLYLNNYSSSTIEEMAFVIWDGAQWNEIDRWDNQDGDIPWGTYTYDITAYAAGNMFQVGFLAEGEDTYNINWWNLDNILVYAPGEIVGTVTELDGGAPIEGATITAGQYTGVTLADGSYSIEVYPDTYDVYCNAVGYNAATAMDVEVLGGVTTTVDFQLTAPTMTVDPSEISDVLWYGQTSQHDITITNEGNGELNWSASLVDNNKDYSVVKPNTKADPNPDANGEYARPPANATDALFDLQFVYDATPPSGELNLTGAECDGEFFYSSKWNGNLLYKFDLGGNFVEEFSIAGVTGIRDLAYDGMYFYGGNGGNTIYVMDFDAQVLIDEISSPGAVRAIAYDSENDAFWCNNWSSDMLLVDRMGNELDAIAGVPSIYGAAYDAYTDGGPYLWLFAGTTSGGGCWVEQWSIADDMFTGVMKSVSDDIPDGIAGGLFLVENIVGATYTLGGMCQASPDSFFGYELGSLQLWAILSENSGTIAPDVKASQTIQLTFDAGAVVPGIYTAQVIFESAEGVPLQTIDLTLEVLGQQIMIPDGGDWGYISTYVDLNSGKMPMEEALADIIEEMTILIGEDGIFWPGFNINTIGDWDTYTGYKIKMAEDAILVFLGEAVTDKTVTFQAGTHIIPVLSEFPVSVDDIFGPHAGAIEFAFAMDGSIYWPNGGIMTLQTLEPGYGYLVRFNQETTLDFLIQTKETMPNAVPQLANNTTWNNVEATGDIHIVGIAPEASSQLVKGDYIGVFNMNGLCTGMTLYTGNEEPMAIAVYGDDMTTDAYDGMVVAEPLTVKVFRNGEEFSVDAVYSPLMPDYDGTFASGGLSMITDLKAGATSVGEMAQEISIYPNPSNGLFNITGVNSATRVLITNSHGQVVYSGEINEALKLDLTDQPTGVYFIELTTDEQTKTEKVVIK